MTKGSTKRATPAKQTKAEDIDLRVIDRAVSVLLTLSDHPEGLSLGEIAKLVDLPRSTVQRIIYSFEEAGMVIAASPTTGFRLGPTLALLAESVRPLDIAKIVRPLILQLASETGETVNLSLFIQGKAVVVDQVTGVYPLQNDISITGASLPLHGTAIGKALLPALPRKALEDLQAHLSLAPLTKNTTTCWDKLLPEIETIRATGLAYDREEYMLGISSVATTLKCPGGELAAVSFPVPTRRFHAKEKALVEVLTTCCGTFQRCI